MSDMIARLLNAAIRYAEMGYPVFPCKPGRKEPLTKNGFHDATTDEARIRRWWTDNPRANIGMPTGPASGLIVIDIDPRNGGEEGLADLHAQHGPLPETAEALTGSGGRHLFFRHPGGYVRCTQSKVAPGVDVKGDGGYVVLPPSVHPNGNIYTWELSSEIGKVSPVACPQWLVDLIRQGGRETPHGPPCGTGQANTIPTGRRNSTLASLAGGMRRMGMSQAEIFAALQARNRARCAPPLPEAEVERIAASIARYEPDAVSVALVENHYGQIFGDGQAEEPEDAPAGADPGPLPESLLYVPGFVAEVMDYCLQTAPYPNHVMAFCGAISLLAFLAGRKVRDPGDNRTNIYLLGLAHSAAGKDHPRKVNTRIVHEVGLADCLGERFASGEGIQDALFVTPSMLFQTDEIDGMLQSINKAKDARHENIMGTLLTMYSSSNSVFPRRRKAGKESPGVIDQPSLVIFGTAIPNHYYQALSERMLTNGFFARMLIIEAGSRPDGQEPQIRPLPPRVLATAKWWTDFRPGTGNLEHWHPEPVVVEYSEPAKRLLIETRQQAEAEYRKAEIKNDPVGTTVWGRVSEQIRKLALLYTISENHEPRHISLAAVEWASRFVMHQTRRMLYMAALHVATSEFDALRKKAIRVLKQYSGSQKDYPVPDWRLRRRLAVNPKAYADVIEALVKEARIEFVTVQAKTRPRTGWVLR